MKQEYMKPSPKNKLHRNALVRQYSADHPELSLGKLAGIFNISRQRIFAIIKAGQESDKTKSPTN